MRRKRPFVRGFALAISDAVLKRGVTQVLALAAMVVLFSIVGITSANAETVPVVGAISADTTWTSGSTYQLTGEVDIAHGARLAVEPGVTVQGGGHTLAVNGVLSAVGSTSSPVVLRNIDLRGRGSYVYPSPPVTFTVDIENADIDGGTLQGSGESMYGSWTLSDSYVTNIDSSIYLWFPLADCRIERNVFIDTGKVSAGVHAANVFIDNNLFYRSDPSQPAMGVAIENWAAYNGYGVHANGNSFLNPGTPSVGFALWSSSGNLDAASNWWGVAPSDTATIASMVLDHAKNALYPSFVDTSTPLTAPDTACPSSGEPFALLPATISGTLHGPAQEVVAGTPVILTGGFTDATRHTAHRGSAQLFASIDGGAWMPVGSTQTALDGSVQFMVTPTRDTSYRVEIQPASGVAIGATSNPVGVLVRAQVGKPSVPRSVKHSRSFAFAGTLSPHKAAGSHSVTVRFYRLEKRKWVLRASARTTNSNFGAASRYAGSTKLRLAGSYRVVATYTEAGRVSVASAISKTLVK